MSLLFGTERVHHISVTYLDERGARDTVIVDQDTWDALTEDAELDVAGTSGRVGTSMIAVSLALISSSRRPKDVLRNILTWAELDPSVSRCVSRVYRQSLT